MIEICSSLNSCKNCPNSRHERVKVGESLLKLCNKFRDFNYYHSHVKKKMKVEILLKRQAKLKYQNNLLPKP